MEKLTSLVEKTVTVRVYYEIKDSEMYGGVGTVGYAMSEHGGIPFENIERITDDFLQKTCTYMARYLQVVPENVRLISKAEYEANVEDDVNVEDDEEPTDTWEDEDEDCD